MSLLPEYVTAALLIQMERTLTDRAPGNVGMQLQILQRQCLWEMDKFLIPVPRTCI